MGKSRHTTIAYDRNFLWKCGAHPSGNHVEPPVSLSRPADPPHMTLPVVPPENGVSSDVLEELQTAGNSLVQPTFIISHSLHSCCPIPTNNEPMVLDADAPAVPPAVESNRDMSGGHRNPLSVFTASVQANHHHQHSTNCTQSTNIEANANLPRPVGYDTMLPLPRLPVAALEPPIKWCKYQFLPKF